jgi:hypothetical protein
MTPRRRMAENERLGCFALLFPPLWPLLLAAGLVAVIEQSWNWVAGRWRRWRYPPGPR